MCGEPRGVDQQLGAGIAGLGGEDDRDHERHLEIIVKDATENRPIARSSG